MKTKTIYTKYSIRLLKFLLLITLVIVVVHMSLQYLNWEVFYQQNGFVYELSNRFDLDDEASVPTWFSQFLFLSVGLSAVLAAYLTNTSSERRIWQLIAVAGIISSIDEVAGLHEFALQSIHNIFYRDAAPTSTNNAWLLVTPFILLAGVWFTIKIASILPKRTIILFASSIVIFLIGAVFFDAVASLVERESFLNQGILIAIEESLELIAVIIVFYAVAQHIESYHGQTIRNTLRQLS